MDFSKYISTPIGHTEDSPLTTRLKLTKGRLTGGFLYFPYGPAGMLHFLARIGIHQILPFNTGENFRLDDAVIRFSLGIDLKEPPYIIDCVTWNDSLLFPHACTINFYLDPYIEPLYDIQVLKKLLFPTTLEGE